MKLTAALVLVATLGLTPDLAAQSVSASEREALVKLRVDRGGQAGDVDALIRQADEAAAKGLPSAPLTNKIREGLAKGHDPKRIEPVVRQMRTQLETADQLMREFDPAGTGAARDASLTLLAESLGGGVTANDVRELRKQAQVSGRPLPSDGLASAAKGLSFITDAKLPVTDGTAVVAEAVRQGFRAHEVLELGREIKRRERDFIAGRSTLREVRDAIARGDRPEQLFRDSRPQPVERPAATRPATPERPERPATPERPARPERPETPTRPERPAARQ